MTWWIERYPRFWGSALIDEVELTDRLSDADVQEALGTAEPVRFAEWRVQGKLVPVVRAALPQARYLTPAKRLIYVYFLGYREEG